MYVSYDNTVRGFWTCTEETPSAWAYAHAESVWLVPGSFDVDAD
jgi:hypothetical protein